MGRTNHRYVDIHTHILPGVDDGAPNLADAVSLLKAAWEQGTGAVILTPHYRDHFRDNQSHKLVPAFREFVQAVQTDCPDMELYLGCEIGYERDISEMIAGGSLMTLNDTDYVLLEFRVGASASRILDGVLEVLNFGYIPIIAHVERYEVFWEDTEFAAEMIRLGALLQINADSVLGHRGYLIKRVCRRLLKRHQVHFIASDTHDMKHRPPALRKCYEKIQKQYGAERANILFCKNARCVLSGGEDIEC